jgi:soluble lytic murein transglycosylase-like protein
MFLRIMTAGLGIALCLAPFGALSAGPAPFPEFQAHRVKPPAPGTARRITIQIAPPAPAAPAETGADEKNTAAASAAAPQRYGWFWDKVSPTMADTGPGRLFDALQVLDGTGDVATPRLQAMQDIARAHGIPILRATIGTRVSPALVLAVIAVESAGDAAAVSDTGAQGLMQLMPETALRFGVSDPFQPDENIAGGVRYLDWLMEKFDSDPILVLAAYNAGAGAVRDNGGVPPFAETRDYVPRVLAAFKVARGLCLTPPELISDGCVFAAMN